MSNINTKDCYNSFLLFGLIIFQRSFKFPIKSYNENNNDIVKHMIIILFL
ncbi:hypothetical protein BVAVS116_E0048 (plasmid) [Borreliella valaisiana VS116]|uniref:Uncharacterized protein n=1 Tax=Borreliella valaisiana VS116 TaxID=445987 RepID=C0R8S9_BORVA|nr:hypothetical protein BVAVS116_E0048 [Borreliella valaisiana VS116]